ncbi:MAG: hypothetical protein Q8Q40_04825 [Methylococcaceae bacterium]|nr:hypothetical protein [Methylococcaceae bacterium]MDP3903277.1 hypothetical protein [Methylococcaceae bacterium]
MRTLLLTVFRVRRRTLHPKPSRIQRRQEEHRQCSRHRQPAHDGDGLRAEAA